jgi:septal ring factor EnvC (AmiA/AmiB activator)
MPPSSTRSLVKNRCPGAGESLSPHIRYLHPGKSQAATALPTTTAPKISAPAPAPVVAPNASVEEHLKTALQELTQRQSEIDEQLSRTESLQLEKEAIAKQIDAVSAALQAFQR